MNPCSLAMSSCVRVLCSKCTTAPNAYARDRFYGTLIRIGRNQELRRMMPRGRRLCSSARQHRHC